MFESAIASSTFPVLLKTMKKVFLLSRFISLVSQALMFKKSLILSFSITPTYNYAIKICDYLNYFNDPQFYKHKHWTMMLYICNFRAFEEEESLENIQSADYNCKQHINNHVDLKIILLENRFLGDLFFRWNLELLLSI